MVDSVLRAVLDTYDGCEMWKCGSADACAAAATLSGIVDFERVQTRWEPARQMPRVHRTTNGDLVNHSKEKKEQVHVHEIKMVEVPTTIMRVQDEARSPDSSPPGKVHEVRQNARSPVGLVANNGINDDNRARKYNIVEGKQRNEGSGEREPSVEVQSVREGTGQKETKAERLPGSGLQPQEEEAVELTLSKTIFSEKTTSTSTVGKDANISSPASPAYEKLPLQEPSSQLFNDNDEGRDHVPIENLSSLTHSLGEQSAEEEEEEESGFGLIPEAGSGDDCVHAPANTSAHATGTRLPPKGPELINSLEQERSEGHDEVPKAFHPDDKMGHRHIRSDPNKESADGKDEDFDSAVKSYSASTRSMELNTLHGGKIGLSSQDAQRGEGCISSSSLNQSCEDTGPDKTCAKTDAPPKHPTNSDPNLPSSIESQTYFSPPTSPTSRCRVLSPNSLDRQGYFSPTQSSNPSYISSTSSSDADELDAILANTSSLSHKGSELSDQAVDSPWLSHDALYSITGDDNAKEMSEASRDESLSNRADAGKAAPASLKPSWSTSSTPLKGFDSIDSILMASSSSSLEEGDAPFDGDISKDSYAHVALSGSLRSALLDDFKILEDDSFDYGEKEVKNSRPPPSNGKELVAAAEEAISRLSAESLSPDRGTSKHTVSDARDDAIDLSAVNAFDEGGTASPEREGIEKLNTARGVHNDGHGSALSTDPTSTNASGPSSSGNGGAVKTQSIGTSIENSALDFEDPSPFLLQVDASERPATDARDAIDAVEKDPLVPIRKEWSSSAEEPCKKNDVAGGDEGNHHVRSHRRAVSCDGRDMKIISLTLQADSQVDSIFRSAAKSPNARPLPDTKGAAFGGEKGRPTPNVSDLAQEGVKHGNVELLQPDSMEVDSIFREFSCGAPRNRSLSESDLSRGGKAQLEESVQKQCNVGNGGSLLRLTRKSVLLSQKITRHVASGLSANEERVKSLSDLSANEEHLKPLYDVTPKGDWANHKLQNAILELEQEYRKRVNELRRQYQSKLEQLKREMGKPCTLLKQTDPMEEIDDSIEQGGACESKGTQESNNCSGNKGSIVQEIGQGAKGGVPLFDVDVSETKRRTSAIEAKLQRLLKSAAHETGVVSEGEESDNSDRPSISTQASPRSDVSESKRTRKDAMEKRLQNLLKRIHSPRNDETSKHAAVKENFSFRQKDIDAEITSKEASAARSGKSIEDPAVAEQNASSNPSQPSDGMSSERSVAIDALNVSTNADQHRTGVSTTKCMNQHYIQEIGSLQGKLNRKLQNEKDALQRDFEEMESVCLQEDDLTESVIVLELEVRSSKALHGKKIKEMRAEHKGKIDSVTDRIKRRQNEYSSKCAEARQQEAKKDGTIIALNTQIKEAKCRNIALQGKVPDMLKSLEGAQEESMKIKDKAKALTITIEQMKLEHRKQLEDERAKLLLCCNKMRNDVQVAVDRQYTEGNKKREALQKEHDKMKERLDALNKLQSIKQSSGQTVKEEGQQRNKDLIVQLEQLKEEVSAIEMKSAQESKTFAETSSRVKVSLDELSSTMDVMRKCATETEAQAKKALAETAELRTENAKLEGWCKELMAVISGYGETDEAEI